MKTRVELDPEVADFARSLAPEPRRRMRGSLRGLEQEKGDLKQLEADLAGYARLRAGSYRVIIRFYVERGGTCRALRLRGAARGGVRVVFRNLARPELRIRRSVVLSHR